MNQEYSFNKNEPKEGSRITRKPDLRDQETMEELKRNFNDHTEINLKLETKETPQERTPFNNQVNTPEETIGVNLADKLEPLYKKLKHEEETQAPKKTLQENISEIKTPPLENSESDLPSDTSKPNVEATSPNETNDPKNELGKSYPQSYKTALEDILKTRQKNDSTGEETKLITNQTNRLKDNTLVPKFDTTDRNQPKDLPNKEILQAAYDRENNPNPDYPPTYKKAVADIKETLETRNKTAKENTETPFNEADLDKNIDPAFKENLDLSDHIEVEGSKKELLPPETIKEIKENLASDGLIENIEKVASRAEEVMAEIESLPDDKKEKVKYGLNTLGYRIDKWKNEKIANILEKSATKFKNPNENNQDLRDQDTLTRFLHGLASGRRGKAEQVENIINNTQNKQGGFLTSAGNIGRPIGTALKISRILSDVGAGAPLRSVMLIASGVEEISRGTKEARLSGDDVLRKKAERNTSLKWHEKEAIIKKGQKEGKTIEEIEEEISIQETARETANNLDNTLYGSLTRKMRSYDELKESRQRLQRVARSISKGKKKNINKLDEARLMLAGMSQGVAQWQNKFWLSRVEKKLNKIENDDKLASSKKELKKQKLFASYENKLTEMERMISGYGTIDVLAMTAKNVETASKGVVLAMMADTLYKAATHVYNLALDKSEYFESILTQDKNTPDDLEPDILPEGPIRYSAEKDAESNPLGDIFKSITDQESNDDIPPIPYRPDINLEDINRKPYSRLALFENTGANVITDPYGKVSVVYEVGQNGDFKTLDQTLRRVVMQAYDDKTPEFFDKVEAARLENVLANIREVIINKHAIAGLNPNTVGEYVKFSDGQLIISDYDKFNRDVFKPLLDRATEKIDQDSPIIKYAQATGEGTWQQMLADKYESKESVIEPNFHHQETQISPEAPTERTPKDISVLEKQMEAKTPLESIKTEVDTNLNHTASILHEKYNFPQGLANSISHYEKDFNITGLAENGDIKPGSKFDVLVNLLNGERSILLTDAKGNLDTNQLVIFNNLVENSNNPQAILSALDITRSLNWTPDGELKLAQALVNPDRPALWQALLGKDIVPDNIKVKIDGTKLSLHKIGGFQGSLMIDFATKKVSVGRLLSQDGWKTDSARFFSYSLNENTFEGALSKALNIIKQAQNK